VGTIRKHQLITKRGAGVSARTREFRKGVSRKRTKVEHASAEKTPLNGGRCGTPKTTKIRMIY